MGRFATNGNGFDYTDNLFRRGVGSDSFFEAIERELPPVFSRRTASQAIGGLVSSKTFSNLDALRQGPPTRVRMGNRVAYERESFMDWLRERMRAW